MYKTISVLASVLLLGSVLGHGSILAYATYGSPYAPSFGGGIYHYADGLVINGKTFDISKFSQKIQTQNFTTGVQSNVTIKIFDNTGSYFVKTATLFLNTRGPSSSVQNSDTWIEYDLSGKTVIEDPHHFIEGAKGSVKYADKIAYVWFTIIPKSPMDVSDMIICSTDGRSYVGYSLVVDAVAFTGKSIEDPAQLTADYLHAHCTTTYPCHPVCGDHICKPGELPKTRP